MLCFASVLSVLAQSTIRFNDPNPILEVGPALSQGARYRFRNVAPGTDALVTVTTINTATLVSIDSVLGFADRFEPTIRLTGANQQGYVRFDFQIVEAGGTTPKIVPAVLISAQDIDGNSGTNTIREWVEFVNTGSVSVGSPTLLVPGTPVAGGIRYNQVSSNNVQPGIGTNDQYEMYTTVLGNNHTFTIIGGNITGSAGCTGGSCSRQNSYSFDPASSNQPPPNADVSITKTGPASVNLGDTVTYNLTASNAGPTTAHGAIVNDLVPTSLTGVTISCSASGGAVCPSTAGLTTLSNVFIPTFPNGGSLDFTITGTTTTTGTLTNTASIAPPNGSNDPNTGNNISNTITTTVVAIPSLSINKSHTGNFTIGSSGIYNFTVTNGGTGPTTGTITFSDTLPANLTVNGGSAGSVSLGGTNGSNWTCTADGNSPQTVSCTSTTALAANGGSSTFTLSTNVGNGTPLGTNSITNTALVYGGGDPAHPTLGTAASDSDPTTVQYLVSCSKVYATGFSGGRTSLYELNGSTMTSVFTAPQNAGGLAISSNGRAYYDNATFANPPMFSFDGLAQTNTGATLPGLLVGEAADSFGNVYYIDNARHLRRANSGGSGAASDLGALVFDAGDTIGPTLQYGDMTFDGNGRLLMYSSINGTGQTYLYVIDIATLTAKNTGQVGPNRATGAAFDAAGNLITTRDGGATVVSINLASASLLGTTIGTASPTVYDMGSCSTPVINPTLNAVKSVTNVTQGQTPATIAAAGDILEYTIVVTNTGNMPSYDAKLADTIPVGTTYAAGTTTLNGTAVTDVGGVMPFVTAQKINSNTQPAGVVVAGGSFATVKFRVTVNSNTLPPQISNTATITYPTASGGTTTVKSTDSNTVNTPTLVPPPSIGLVKSCPAPANCTTAPQLPDTELTYQIDFSNTGGTSAANLILVDAIPTSTDFKLASVSTNLGTTGLTFVIEYSSDYNPGNPTAATWTYTPTSGGGGADSGFDRNVKAIRWRVTSGSLSQTAPNNTGNIGFIVKIR